MSVPQSAAGWVCPHQTCSAPGLRLWSPDPPDGAPSVHTDLILAPHPAEARTRLPGGWGGRVWEQRGCQPQEEGGGGGADQERELYSDKG